MKDLAFLMLALGLVMLATMFAQNKYRGQERAKNQTWERKHPSGHIVQITPTPSASPTAR